MPSLDNLRSHKNTPTNFTPSKAYWLSGHGGEVSDGSTFTVPPGCVIVVKVSPGKFSYLGNVYAGKISSMDKNKLKDPLRNTNYLIQNFGSIAIFKPGDVCPLFYYLLLSCMPSDSVGQWSRGCSDLGSGVIDIDNITSSASNIPINPIIDINIDKYTANLFEKSEYPTKKKIQSEIAKLPSEFSLFKSPLQKFRNLINKLSSVLIIDQKTICETLGKGVYYNFICRYRGQATLNLEGNLLYNSEGNWHSSVKGVEELGSTQANTFRLIRNRIAEAEVKRKGLLHKYYTSPEYYPYRPHVTSSYIQNPKKIIFDILTGIKGTRKIINDKLHEIRRNKKLNAKTTRNQEAPINWLRNRQTQKNTSQNILNFDAKDWTLFNEILISPIEKVLKMIKQINNSNFNESLARKSHYKDISSKNAIINFNNPDSDYSEEKGATPLWLAVKYNKSELIKPLIQAGANTDVVVGGKKLLDIAKAPAASLLRKYSKKTSAEINLLNKQDAATEKEEKISQLLSYYAISDDQKKALSIKLGLFTIEQIKNNLLKKQAEATTATAAVAVAEEEEDEEDKAAVEKQEKISQLLSYYDISAAQKDALRIKLGSFTIEQIKAKLQLFLDKNAQKNA